MYLYLKKIVENYLNIKLLSNFCNSYFVNKFAYPSHIWLVMTGISSSDVVRTFFELDCNKLSSYLDSCYPRKSWL